MPERTAVKHPVETYVKVKLEDPDYYRTGGPEWITRNLYNLKPTATPLEIYDSTMAFFTLGKRWVQTLDVFDINDLEVIES